MSRINVRLRKIGLLCQTYYEIESSQFERNYVAVAGFGKCRWKWHDKDIVIKMTSNTACNVLENGVFCGTINQNYKWWEINYRGGVFRADLAPRFIYIRLQGTRLAAITTLKYASDVIIVPDRHADHY